MESGYAGSLVDWLPRAVSGERVSRRMPWNGKEEKIMGTVCNHHEMMVAMEKRIPVNLIFYLVKVMSPLFLR